MALLTRDDTIAALDSQLRMNAARLRVREDQVRLRDSISNRKAVEAMRAEIDALLDTRLGLVP